MEHRICDDMFPNSITFFLSVARALHRHVLGQRRLLLYAVRIASLRGGKDIAELREGFDFLGVDMDRMLQILEDDVRFLTLKASIKEGQLVGLVSKFAALFLPVSLLATILTISDPGYMRWAILGGLSVPFVLISIFFMFFWKPPHVDHLEY